MPHPLSNDLRERVVAFVEAGHSCHEAAARLDTSVSFVVNLMALWRETGSVAPRPAGGRRHGKLDAAEAFLLAAVARAPDITMPELAAALLEEKAIAAAPQSLSRWLIKKGLSFKKKHFGPASKTSLNSPGPGRSGGRAASQSCAASGTGSSSSTRQARQPR
jgi:transposase